jgi:hypothetical protein
MLFNAVLHWNDRPSFLGGSRVTTVRVEEE